MYRPYLAWTMTAVINAFTVLENGKQPKPFQVARWLMTVVPRGRERRQQKWYTRKFRIIIINVFLR